MDSTHRNAALAAIGAAKSGLELSVSKDAQAIVQAQLATTHALLYVADVLSGQFAPPADA